MSEALATRLHGAAPRLARQRAGRTSYVDRGAGEVVVFIHGVGLNADAWHPQIDAFAATHRIIALDMLGHGDSDLPPQGVTLGNYVEQVLELLTFLDISAANIVGHSMGGLVAIGFALAHPQKTLRLAVLNAVYKRSPEKRAAVQSRAQEISKSGTCGNIEEPLERWFGPRGQQPPAAKRVREWLSAASPIGYAAAYRIFANNDEAFVGRLAMLSMPALIATGSKDVNSPPDMAKAMAAEAPNGKPIVLDGERHMMNLTNPAAVNRLLEDFLSQPLTAIDPKDLRKAFGAFMTGVTVVTTREPNGSLRGFTANSFSSVSLDPPLLLVCVSKAAASCEAFTTAPSFAVNILAETQKGLSGVFASKRPDKFADVAWTESASGNPLISGSVAWFDCARHSVVDAGDHHILIGRVTSYVHNNSSPLGYARGGYFSLGLEQSAVNAAAQAGRAEVGAILECAGQLLVFAKADGRYELPHVGRGGEAGTVSRLLAQLDEQGISAKLGFLFAVYENREDHTQCIYYRGEVEGAGAGKATVLNFDDLPWDKFRDDATRSMLKRYSSERLQGRYRIYSGDHVSGDVRDVSE